MRPGIGGEEPSSESPRPRKLSIAASPSITSDRDRHVVNTGTTFFLSRDPDASTRARPSECHHAASAVSPLSNLQDTIQEAELSSSVRHAAPRAGARTGSRRRSTIKPVTAERMLRRDSSENGTVSESSPPHQAIFNSRSRRETTPSPRPSRDVSLPSSPRSLTSRASRQSLPKSTSSGDDLLTNADETGSQAVMSSGEEDEDESARQRVGPAGSQAMLDGIQDSQPELIMPSIKMPSRRPFTERGKSLGRIKIMVAGRKGVGKTSLIKSIVQLCEDIVHVDAISSTGNASNLPHSQTYEVSEVYASTKPYPEWWSTIEESRILRRRKSMGDSVLERNICFVDTSDCSKLDHIIQYTEQQLAQAISTVQQSSSEFAGLLSGRGASQVDVILYLISKDHMQDDMHNFFELANLCNVVPLIARADLMSADDLDNIKQTVDPAFSSLPSIRVPANTQSKDTTSSLTAESFAPAKTVKAPFAISSSNGPDLDTMDASLLMSPEYIQPLLPSELSILVNQLFDPDTVAYLRYIASRKLVAWHASHPRLTKISPSSTQSHNASMRASALSSPPRTPLSMSNSGVLNPIGSEVSFNTSNSWALAKVADHTQREERLAQIRLSKWASELQLSLQRERERYERLARGDRAVWLVEKMGEEVRDGNIRSNYVDNGQALVHKHGKFASSYGGDLMPSYQMHDPLGLLRWQDSVRTRGWIALQIVGGFGVMGGLAFWLAKHFGMMGGINEWWTQGLEYFGWHD